MEEVIELLKKSKKSLSVAESCTGGRLAAFFTKQAGSSSFFLGGVVAYHNRIKEKILSVDQKVLQEQGAVSEKVVRQMAEGVQRLFSSDFALACSGVAGPDGGSLHHPVGMVWMSLATKGEETKVWCENFSGERSEVMEKTVRFLEEKLRLSLKS